MADEVFGLDLLGGMPEWYQLALCAETDPEAFFPEKGGSTREAKGVCGRCEVRDECLTYALETRTLHGVWGGKTDKERRRMLRKLDAAEAEPVGGGA